MAAGRHAACLWTALAVLGQPVQAHPHVFVDGGVDFLFGDERTLTALEVTWLYDEFETLYILSSHGMSLNAAGGLDEDDRVELVRQRSQWPSDFEGSAHMSIDGAQVALERPVGFEADLVHGRLQMTFTRHLETPVMLSDKHAEVAFYEATYFYAFGVTNMPKLFGDANACDAEVIQHDPNEQDTVLQAALGKLSREETPEIEEVGALFADRISVRCG